ncbi:hypothetical protein HLB23_40200 [Nocardia uniformis]|uniref:Uncharacterized protein n=1 Tax=Nocardia uniformis TaxID=53432 RepID=A0A849CDF2_9NOCA|nr:hypothetical protein [Nocardia uniformis]NNH76006.1 hypothetical protein [Nocardia uniformis]
MTDTPDDLRRRATRLRRGVGQLGVLESVIDAAEGPWLGAMDADGRGAAELRMHLVGRYRLTVVVSNVGKLNHVQMTTPSGEWVLSSKTLLRRGWTDTVKMPKQSEWLNYVVDWVTDTSGAVDRRAVIEWRLIGADRLLANMNDTIDSVRANLLEREEVRDELAAEVAGLRAELETLGSRDETSPAAAEQPMSVADPVDASEETDALAGPEIPPVGERELPVQQGDEAIDDDAIETDRLEPRTSSSAHQ